MFKEIMTLADTSIWELIPTVFDKYIVDCKYLCKMKNMYDESIERLKILDLQVRL